MSALQVRDRLAESLPLRAVAFLGELPLPAATLLRGKARFPWSDFVRVQLQCGGQALVIVIVVNVLVGAILAFVGAVQLVKFGAGIYVADLVGIAVACEMAAVMTAVVMTAVVMTAVVMTAVVMAGRTGASFAAELATMQANEEVDALVVLGLDPSGYLVLPRVLALTLMMPLLYFYSCTAGLLGGLGVAAGLLDISPSAYIERGAQALNTTQFMLGASKSAVFGALVGITGCGKSTLLKLLDIDVKRPVAHGSPKLLREQCQHPTVRAFLHREEPPAAALVWLSASNWFDSQLHAVVYFENSVAGRYKGAPVTYRGVVVGQVESIGLDMNQRTLKVRIPVRIRLSRGAVTFSGGSAADPVMESVTELVQRGLRAKLFSPSLVTGQRSIKLNTITDAPQVRIAASPLPEIPVVADRFDSLVDQLSELPLSDVVKALRNAMTSMRETLSAAREPLAIANATVGIAGQELGAVGAQAGRTLRVARDAVVQVQAGAKTAFDSVTRLADTAQSTVLAACAIGASCCRNSRTPSSSGARRQRRGGHEPAGRQRRICRRVAGRLREHARADPDCVAGRRACGRGVAAQPTDHRGVAGAAAEHPGVHGLAPGSIRGRHCAPGGCAMRVAATAFPTSRCKVEWQRLDVLRGEGHIVATAASQAHALAPQSRTTP